MSEQPQTSLAPGKTARASLILARIALGLGIICAVASVMSGLGHRFDWWSFRAGFQILRYATYGAFAVIALGLIAAIMAQTAKLRQARTLGLLGLVVGVLVAAPPLYQFYVASHVPPIHDISTDMVNPPTFVAIVARRAIDDNSLEPNADTEKKQAEAYPDIKPVMMPMPPAQALTKAEAAARGMGWEIVAVDPQAMRIEATATTLLYGFKDDVVIRVAADGSGSRIDIRSASRVGRSDIGVNAKRVRAYIQKLETAAG
jgi:uncharacterized protein (DUF1499 family)